MACVPKAPDEFQEDPGVETVVVTAGAGTGAEALVVGSTVTASGAGMGAGAGAGAGAVMVGVGAVLVGRVVEGPAVGVTLGCRAQLIKFGILRKVVDLGRDDRDRC